MIMRAPAARACSAAAIAAGISWPTPTSTSARPPVAAIADPGAGRAPAVIRVMPASIMRPISLAWASVSIPPAGPNGVTGMAATVARVLRIRSAAAGSRRIGTPGGHRGQQLVTACEVLSAVEMTLRYEHRTAVTMIRADRPGLLGGRNGYQVLPACGYLEPADVGGR